MRRHPWLTAALVFVVLCGVLYFCLEWRAEQRWLRYAADAKARGVKLLLTDFARPEIADDQNFAALPMMRKAFAGGADSVPLELPLWSRFPKGGPAWVDQPRFDDPIKGQTIDWVEWQKYFLTAGFLTQSSDNPVSDVLRALEHYAPQFQEWSEWRTRPQCRFPLDLAKGVAMPQPPFHAFQQAEKVFALRMRAHLALGDSVAAYLDFREGLQAYLALKDEPTAIAGLVRVSVLYPFLGSAGEGLRLHAWKEPELQKIEANLAAIRGWDDYRLALASERGWMNTTSESMLQASGRDRGKVLAQLYNGSQTNPMPVIVFQLLPRSVFRENQLRQNRYIDELMARPGSTSQGFDPDLKTPSSPMKLTGPLDRYYYMLIADSDYGDIERRYIWLQTRLDQVRLACALERFRLAHGAFPEALTQLVPEFIGAVPTDIYASAPYRYQRMGEGSFRLYGVGENRQDDGGQLAPGVSEQKQLDAIWLYAPPAAVRKPDDR